MDSLLHRRIHGYEVVRVLGEGGMGVVYELSAPHLETRLAMKVLRPEFARHPQIAPRFRQEAMLAAKVKQPPTYKEPHRHVVEDRAGGAVAEDERGEPQPEPHREARPPCRHTREYSDCR